MKLFNGIKTPIEFAAESIANAYFNGEILESDDIRNFVKQCNINPYELVFHTTNLIGAKTLQSFVDIARDYPILKAHWFKTSINNEKIESDLRILLNIALPGEVMLAEGCTIEEVVSPKRKTITQDVDKMISQQPSSDKDDDKVAWRPAIDLSY